MQSLVSITDQLATAWDGTDASDPAALAALHSGFEELCQAALELEQGRRDDIRDRAIRTGKVLEELILHQAADVEAACQEVAGSITALKELVSSIDATPGTLISSDDAPLVGEFISEARGHIESAESGILKVEEHPDDPEAINAIFRAFHTIKGAAGFLNFEQIGSLAHAAENLLDLGRRGELKLVGATVDVILESIDLMKALFVHVEEAMKSSTPVSTEARLAGVLKRLQACADGNSEAPVEERGPVAATSQAPATSPSPTQEANVKVATGRLDALIDMVGELVIAESMVRQGLGSMTVQDQRLLRNAAHMGKITRHLQDLSMSMRMVPIQGTFQKMSRLVRDLVRKSGKQTELSMAGAETELDRNVVEAIADPLMHMIRNAVDHGIEPADERQHAGKPSAGRVELKAYHQGGNIVIEISDDGRGLRKDKILKKAIAAGLVKDGQDLSESEIFNLIFHAGLSTAEKLTDVSGRGVGMDVVKRNVEALRGQIVIRSTEGKGSTFTIRLPLTLAVIDGLAVRVGRERYILPITSVEQSIRPTAQQISTLQHRGEMCVVRGKLLPLIRIHRVFNIDTTRQSITDGIVVIVQDNHRRCCLLVDDVLGQQQVVIKSLGGGIGKVAGISGGAILGDGNVSLILDVPGLIDASTSHLTEEGVLA